MGSTTADLYYKGTNHELIQCADVTLENINGEWEYLELNGDNILWTAKDCDHVYEVLKLRHKLLGRDL